MAEWEDDEPAECFGRINSAATVHEMEIEIIGVGVGVAVVHEVHQSIASTIQLTNRGTRCV